MHFCFLIITYTNNIALIKQCVCVYLMVYVSLVCVTGSLSILIVSEFYMDTILYIDCGEFHLLSSSLNHCAVQNAGKNVTVAQVRNFILLPISHVCLSHCLSMHQSLYGGHIMENTVLPRKVPCDPAIFPVLWTYGSRRCSQHKQILFELLKTGASYIESDHFYLDSKMLVTQ